MTARLGVALATALLLGCEITPSASQPAASASPTPEAPLRMPTPAALRPPAAAMLEDAAVGLPRLSGRDGLGAAEAARDQPDEPAALEVFSGWGWIEASTRTWGSGSRRLDAIVMLSLRAQGARRAYEFWAAEADRMRLAGAPCPATVTGLDDCRYWSGGGRTLVVGRLDAEVFRLLGTGVDAGTLAPAQAQRLGR
jgi:hypothetical protein